MKPDFIQAGISVYNGDCFELIKEIPNQSVDMILTDPPYGVGIAGWDVAPDLKFLEECFRICKGPIIMFSGASVRSIKEFMKLEPQRMLIWSPNFTLLHLCSNGIAWRFHPIWCWNLPPKQNGITWDVLKDNTECGNWWKHPCTKPISLMRKLVGISKLGDTILEPFLGSGTTAVACAELGRKCIGIEINKDYCDIAVERVKKVLSQTRLKF